MALNAVELCILEMLGKVGYLQSASSAVTEGGTRMWAKVDAVDDETFENTMEIYATAADDELGRETAPGTLAFVQMPKTQALMQRIDYYIRTVLGYSTGIGAWLLDKGLRVNQQTKDVLGNRGGLVATHLGGVADIDPLIPGQLLGSFLYGGALVVGTPMDITVCSGSPILVRPTVLGAADWTLTITTTIDDGTIKVIDQVIAGTGAGGAVGDEYVLGEEASDGAQASGQKVFTCAATAQFKAGQQVLLSQWTGDDPDEVYVAQEIATIATIQANTSLTMVANLKHSYTDAAVIRPMCLGVTVCTESGGNAADAAEMYPAPDRRLRK